MRGYGVFVALVVLATSTISISAYAACGKATNSCQVNGCGPDGLWGKLIPDSIWRTCRFASACNKHDKCYSRCQKCGDLFGCPVCGYSRTRINGKVVFDKAAKERKARCDSKFERDIIKDNEKSWFTWLCKRAADRYAAAVRKRGGGYYNGYEPPPDVVREIRGEFQALDRLWNYHKTHPGSISLSEIDKKLDKYWSNPDRGVGYLKFKLEKGKPTLSFVSPKGPSVPLISGPLRGKEPSPLRNPKFNPKTIPQFDKLPEMKR